MEQDRFTALRRYNSLYNEIDSVYHDVSVKMGISDSVSSILYILCTFGGKHPLGEISRYYGLSKQTVNSAIRKLEQEGIVYLEAIDGKAKMVCLTEAGKALSERTVLRLMEMEDTIYASWPREDLDKYLELMERFLSSLRQCVEQWPMPQKGDAE